MEGWKNGTPDQSFDSGKWRGERRSVAAVSPRRGWALHAISARRIQRVKSAVQFQYKILEFDIHDLYA
jgi:hypothetical protein